MNELRISPTKAEKYGVKIAKDGVYRSANSVLAQKGVKFNKIKDIWPEIGNIAMKLRSRLKLMLTIKVI